MVCQCYWGVMYWVNNCAFLWVKSWVQYYHMSRNCRVLGECLICQFVNRRLLPVHFVFHYSPLGHKSEPKNIIVFVPGTLPLFESNIRQHVLSKSGLPPTRTKEIPDVSVTVKQFSLTAGWLFYPWIIKKRMAHKNMYR